MTTPATTVRGIDATHVHRTAAGVSGHGPRAGRLSARRHLAQRYHREGWLAPDHRADHAVGRQADLRHREPRPEWRGFHRRQAESRWLEIHAGYEERERRRHPF